MGNWRVFRVFSPYFVVLMFHVFVCFFFRGICGFRGFGRMCCEFSVFLRSCSLCSVFFSSFFMDLLSCAYFVGISRLFVVIDGASFGLGTGISL